VPCRAWHTITSHCHPHLMTAAPLGLVGRSLILRSRNLLDALYLPRRVASLISRQWQWAVARSGGQWTLRARGSSAGSSGPRTLGQGSERSASTPTPSPCSRIQAISKRPGRPRVADHRGHTHQFHLFATSCRNGTTACSIGDDTDSLRTPYSPPPNNRVPMSARAAASRPNKW
jgi:hypothetical protein